MSDSKSTFLGKEIISVYSGKADRCCCGCSGNHSKNPAAIKRAITKFNKLVADGSKVETGDNNFCIENDTRMNILYFGE